MKTAMQNLLNRIEFIFYTELQKEKEWWDLIKREHIDLERTQIVSACNYGIKYGYTTKGEQYYNKTYNQNK